MARTLNEQFKLWKNRVNQAEKCHKEQAKEWAKFVDAYEGKILDTKKSDFNEHLASVNLFYVDVRSSVPKLYSQNPYLYIDPETPEADLHSEVMEKLVNVQKDRAWFLKPRMEELIKGTKLKGRAYLKTNYKFDGDKIGREYAGEEPNDEVCISFVDRDSLIVDPNARSFNKRRWAAHKIHEPIEYIREKFKIKKDVKITVVEEKDLPDHLSPDEKEDFQYGCYFEIENVVDHKLAIVVDGMDGFAVKPYEMPYPYWSMYDTLEWNHIPGRLDTKADLHFWWRNLIELCEIETQKHHHRRKLNSKYIHKGPKKLNDSAISKLKSYKDGIIVTLPPGHEVSAFQHATLGQEVYLTEQSVRQDITVVSGMNEMKQGLPQTRKTAREAMAIVQESQDVISYRSGQVEDTIASVIQKAILLVQKHYDTTRVIGLTGMESAEFLGFKEKIKSASNIKVLGNEKKPFISFVGTELTGKFKVKVKSGSAMPVNEAQRKADLEQLIQIMGLNQNLAAAVDPQELGKEVSKALHMENKNIIINPKSPEQENALLKRNIPVMPQLNEPHDDHLARHDLENNNTPAFLAHQMSHRLMKKFIEGSAMESPAALKGSPGMPGDIMGQRVSGLPQGSSVPPGGMPTQQPGPASTQVPAGQGPQLPN